MFPSEISVNTFLNFCEISKNTFLHRTALVPTSTYCNFKRALATYIWMVLSFFQEVTCSDLVFSRVLCFFELAIIPVFKDTDLIRHSSCSHPFDEWSFFYYKRATAVTHSFKFTVFFRTRGVVARRYHIVINYDTSFVSGMYKLKESLLFGSSLFLSQKHLKRSI